MLFLCPNELIIDGTDDAAATATAVDGVCNEELVAVDEDARAGGKSGECELAEVLVDAAANGTPDDEYKS